MDEAKNVQDGVSEELEDTTVNAYASALDWPCLGMGRKTLVLKNTDAANALKYKVETYANSAGNAYEEVAETILSSGNLAQVILEYSYARVVVSVKSSVGDSHATYALDYVGNKN